MKRSFKLSLFFVCFASIFISCLKDCSFSVKATLEDKKLKDAILTTPYKDYVTVTINGNYYVSGCSVSEGELPPGVELELIHPRTISIQGRPKKGGVYPFKISATIAALPFDSTESPCFFNQSNSRGYTLKVID